MVGAVWSLFLLVCAVISVGLQGLGCLSVKISESHDMCYSVLTRAQSTRGGMDRGRTNLDQIPNWLEVPVLNRINI